MERGRMGERYKIDYLVLGRKREKGGEGTKSPISSSYFPCLYSWSLSATFALGCPSCIVVQMDVHNFFCKMLVI